MGRWLWREKQNKVGFTVVRVRGRAMGESYRALTFEGSLVCLVVFEGGWGWAAFFPLLHLLFRHFRGPAPRERTSWSGTARQRQPRIACCLVVTVNPTLQCFSAGPDSREPALQHQIVHLPNIDRRGQISCSATDAALSGHATNIIIHTKPTNHAMDTHVHHDIYAAATVAEIHATLAHLHHRESKVTQQLNDLIASQKDLSRELGRLDLLRAHLGAQAVNTRAISNGMLSEAASTAHRISSAVKRLDQEQSNVKATLEVVEQVAELKACVLGVHGSMGAPQDWETAAGYLNRASKIPDEVIDGSFAEQIVPTAEVPDPPRVTLNAAAESLCGLFLREFEKATKEGDGSKVTRFFKLFPLIGRTDVGLDAYGRYVCQGVASRARTNLNSAMASQRKEGFFYGNILTKLFEHIAQIVDNHERLVEQHYGPGMMAKVIERLQIEADVQGGILLDTWYEEKTIDRRLTDIKSYAFSFLVQSFLPSQKPTNGIIRTGSPASQGGRSSEDEGVNMKEVDALLGECALMQGRWALYTRFLSSKCAVSYPVTSRTSSTHSQSQLNPKVQPVSIMVWLCRVSCPQATSTRRWGII